MFVQDGAIVLENDEDVEGIKLLIGAVIDQVGPVAGPFDTHAANLESLADDIEAGMLKIATGTEIPEDLTTDDVSEELVQNDADLANAAQMMVVALRLHAADWRQAGASLA